MTGRCPQSCLVRAWPRARGVGWGARGGVGCSQCGGPAREVEKLRALVALRGHDASAPPPPSMVMRATREGGGGGAAAPPPPTERGHYSAAELKPAPRPERLRRAEVRPRGVLHTHTHTYDVHARALGRTTLARKEREC